MEVVRVGFSSSTFQNFRDYVFDQSTNLPTRQPFLGNVNVLNSHN